VNARATGQNGVANARPIGSLLSRQDERLGNRRAQKVRGMQRMEMMHAMQMRPVQMLAVQDVKVSLVMKRVIVMLVMQKMGRR